MMTNGDNRTNRETYGDLTGAQTLGMVVSGSLTEGMIVRLDADRSIEEIKVGTFVNIQGQHMRFFGVVTDAALASMDPSMPAQPPDVSDPFIAQVVSGTAAYGTITVEPMLTIGGIDSIAGLDGPQPARTVPPHFSRVGTATEYRYPHRVRRGGRQTLLDRQSVGHGDAAVPEHRRDGEAVERRLRQERHGQDLPDATAPGGHSSKGRRQQSRLRHAQRVRLAGNVGGIDQHSQRPQAAFPVQGRGLQPR